MTLPQCLERAKSRLLGQAPYALITCLLAVAAPAATGQTIPNPGFELDTFAADVGYVNQNTPITGWTALPTNRIGLNPTTALGNPFADNGAVPDGAQVAFIQSVDGETSTLSTTITGLTPGATYRVQFRANRRASQGAPSPSYRIGDTAPVFFDAATAVDAAGVHVEPYFTVKALFTATGTTAILEISNTTGHDSTLLVDNFLVIAAIPIQVTSAETSGPGSLVEALDIAEGTPEPNVITFAPALNGATIVISQVLVDDSGGVAIDASSLANGITVRCGPSQLIFAFSADTLASLRNVTATGPIAADGIGRAIDNSATLTIDQCTFTGNVGAFFGSAIDTKGHLALTDCLFSNNSCLAEGGAIACSTVFCSLSALRCTFSGNHAANHGGALSTTSRTRIEQCTFSGNTAGQTGGAIIVHNGEARITYCTFSGNSATNAGGAVRQVDWTLGSCLFTHCTISGNAAQSGGGILNAGPMTVANCIVYGNTASVTSAAADVENIDFAARFTRVGANFIQHFKSTGSASDSGPAANTSDPLLSVLSKNGGPTKTRAISPASPARDAGAVFSHATDQRGFPIRGLPDAGAYEVQGNVFTLSASHYRANEGLPVEIIVYRGDEITGEVSVRLFTTNGTAGTGDFTPRPDTAASVVTFADGELSKSVFIGTTADVIAEQGEMFMVTLGSPSPGSIGVGVPGAATVTIAESLQVTNTNDSGPGSVRQAFATAAAQAGHDTITFAANLNGATITLGSSIVVHDVDGVNADASVLPAGVTIDGGPGNNRIFDINFGAILLRRFTFAGGNGNGALPANDGIGGAILNQSLLTVEDCSFIGNANLGQRGGALHNVGRAVVTRCLFANNRTILAGGAVFNDYRGTLIMSHCTLSGNFSGDNTGLSSGGALCNAGAATLTHCTLTGNTVTDGGYGGGGIFSDAVLTLKFCVVAGNSAVEGADIRNRIGTLTIEGPSIVPHYQNDGHTIGFPSINTSDPLLHPLADNGGPTKTHALRIDSLARDAATGSMATSDQRGLSVVGTPDLGAFELRDGGVFTLDQPSYTASEGSPASIVIRRTAGIGAVSVRLFTVPGNAAASDFAGRPNDASAVVNFGAADSAVTVNINTAGDSIVEPNETFTVSLGTPTGSAFIGAPSSANVTIVDPSALAADGVNPAAPIITTPAQNAIVAGTADGTLVVAGTATDNKGVLAVNAMINGIGPIPLDLAKPGASSTAFSGTIRGAAIPGANTLTVTTMDFMGRTTTSSVRTFKVLMPLVVNVGGSGFVTPGYSPNSLRQVGQQYSITATANFGAMFVNWTILSGHTPAQLGITNIALEKPTLTFIFRQGLILRANFVPNPYTNLGGEYNGLVHASPSLPGIILLGPGPEDVTPRNVSSEGMLTVTMQSNGAFSGRMTIDGTVLIASGVFDHAGIARFGSARTTSVAVPRPNKPSLVASFTIDLTPWRARDTISGTVIATDFRRSVQTGISTVTADRAFYDALTPATTVHPSYLGVGGVNQPYTAIVLPMDNSALGLWPTDYPQGTGYALISLSRGGVVTVTAARLADGTTFTAATRLSKDNRFCLFVPLYANQGWISGDVQLDSSATESDMSSTLSWLRPLDNTKQHYPAGWTEVIDVEFLAARFAPTFSPAGSALLRPDGIDADAVGDRLLSSDPLLGNATLTFSDGLLTSPLEKLLNVSTTNVITKVPANDATYTLSFTLVNDAPNGLFTGKFVHELDDGVFFPPVTDFQGVLYQKCAISGGHGFFLTRQPTPIDYTGESGAVKLIGN